LRALIIVACSALTLVSAAHAKTVQTVQSVQTVPVRPDEMPIKRLDDGGETRVPPVADEVGWFPQAWQSAWCPIPASDRASSTLPETTVYRRTKSREQCGDDFVILSKGGAQEYYESGCQLLDGFWNEEARTYRGIYECGGEGSLWFTQLTFSQPHGRGGLVVTTNGSLDNYRDGHAPTNDAPANDPPSSEPSPGGG
jgi:hypothetical protein